MLTADLVADWQRAAADDLATLKLGAKQLRLADFALRPAGAAPDAAPISIGAIELVDANLDPATRRVDVGRLLVRRPTLALERGADRRWNAERWLAGGPQPAPAVAADNGVRPPQAAIPAAGPMAPRWQFALGDLAIEGGALQLRDLAARVPVTVDLREIGLKAGGLGLDAPQPAPLAFSARVTASVSGARSGAARGDAAGRIDFRGSVGPLAGGVPSAVRGALTADDLPLAAFEPYFGGRLNVGVERALASLRGDLDYAAAAGESQLRFKGDAVLGDVRAVAVAADTADAAPVRGAAPARASGDRSTGSPVLRWKSLDMRGIDLALAPGMPVRVAVQESTLTDFFARLVVDERGRLNLQDLLRSEPPSAVAEQAAASVRSAGSVTTVQLPATPPARDGPAPVIRLGPTAFVNGRIEFTDRFIRPSYSASLTRLTGRLGAFSSAPPPAGAAPQLAELELRGNAEDTASLEIGGRLNPLAKPLALDIRARVRDLDLPPLSPYAVKYAGYGIERGRMSVDVAYVVAPDGRLTASNNIVLNQLVFGDKVDGAPNSLPVKLAAALLADREGVINLDLPVSGSINDPQFSIGGVVLKLVGNLIVKAVSSPFRLITAAVQGAGAGGEADRIEFAPGSAALDPTARRALDAVAAALAERPQLRITVVGTSSLEAEREGWKRERLQRMVQAEKRRGLAGRGETTATATATDDEIAVDDADYPAWLGAVYRRSDLAKPQGLLGAARELPASEMEALLLAGMSVDAETMQRLAMRRAAAVRDYLLHRGLPPARVFLGATRPAADGAVDHWTPHADLKLSLQ